MFSLPFLAAMMSLFVIGNFYFGIFEGAPPMGFYATSAQYNPVYETYMVLTQGDWGQRIDLILNLTVFQAIFQVITWNYPILNEFPGWIVKFVVCIPVSFFTGVGISIMMGQLTRVLGKTS